MAFFQTTSNPCFEGTMELLNENPSFIAPQITQLFHLPIAPFLETSLLFIIEAANKIKSYAQHLGK